MNIFVLSLSTSNYMSVVSSLRSQNFDVSPLEIKDLPSLPTQSIIFIPGVGNIGALHSEITSIMPVKEFRRHLLELNHYVVGICLGFQFMCKLSHEDSDAECLNIFPLEVTRIGNQFEIPSVGWQKIHLFDSETCMRSTDCLIDVLDSKTFYFTHSYAVVGNDTMINSLSFHYQLEKKLILGAVMFANFIGLQFHPEKSGSNGLLLLRNIIKLIEASACD